MTTNALRAEGMRPQDENAVDRNAPLFHDGDDQGNREDCMALPSRRRLLSGTCTVLGAALLVALAVWGYAKKRAEAYLINYVVNSDGVSNMAGLVDALRSEPLIRLICADYEHRLARGDGKAMFLLTHYYLLDNRPAESLSLMAKILTMTSDPRIQKGVRQDMLTLWPRLARPVDVEGDEKQPSGVISIQEGHEPHAPQDGTGASTSLGLLLQRGLCRGKTFLIDAEGTVSAQTICATAQSIQAYGGRVLTHDQEPRMTLRVTSYDTPFFEQGFHWGEGMTPITSVVETYDEALRSEDVLKVVMRRDGGLIVAGVLVSDAFLQQALARLKTERKRVVVACDSECTWSQVYSLIGRLREGGVSKVVFVAQRLPGDIATWAASPPHTVIRVKK